jgi:hypothetical protein
VSPGAIKAIGVTKPPDPTVAVSVSFKVPEVTDVDAVAIAVNDAKTEELTKADPPSAAETTTAILTVSRPAPLTVLTEFLFIYFSLVV